MTDPLGQSPQARTRRLRTLLDSLNEAVLLEDANRRLIVTNQRFCDMFDVGAEPEQMRGVDCAAAAQAMRESFVEPELFITRIEEILRNSEPVEDEHIYMVDGRVLSRDYVPLKSKPEGTGHLWTYRDTTAQYQRESKLWRNQILLESLSLAQEQFIAPTRDADPFARLLDDLVMMSGSVGGVIGAIASGASGDDASVHILALREDVARRGGFELAPDQLRAPLPGVLLESSEVLLDDASPPFSDSIWRHAPSGLNAVIPLGQPDETYRGFVGLYGAADGYGDDLQEVLGELLSAADTILHAQRQREAHRETRRRLAQRDQRLQAVVDASMDAVVTLDEAGSIKSWNESARRIFGWSSSEVVEQSLRALLDIQPRGDTDALPAPIGASPRPLTTSGAVAVSATHKDQTELPCELSLTQLSSSTEHRYTCFIRDVSDVHRARARLVEAKEAAESADRAKSDFLATMSHELRTPLNIVLGAVDLLGDGDLEADQRELLETARASASSLLFLIEDLLDFEKIEAGKLDLRPVPFAPRALVEELAAMFRLSAQRNGLEFCWDVADDLPARVVGDSQRVRQVLVNLLGNAIKYTDAGKVSLHVECSPDETEDGESPANTICFRVRDTGRGIPEEQQGLIFDRFHRVDAQQATSGSGLGLAVSKHVVEKMGGQIGVESTVGEGSEFTVTIPFEPVSADSTPTIEMMLDELSAARTTRALLVEDIDENRMVLRRFLQTHDFEVVEAANGLEGVERFEAEDVDFVLMDLRMPDLDGFEAARRIREFERDQSIEPTPMIALTANVEPDTERRCYEAGMDAYLTKPLDRGNLLETIHSVSQPLPRVLVVDDDATTRILMAKLLEPVSRNVELAADWRGAVEAAHVDIAFIDWELPDKHGGQVLAELRRAGMDGPAFALSGHTGCEFEKKVIDAGFEQYLAKPIPRETLHKLIRRTARPGD